MKTHFYVESVSVCISLMREGALLSINGLTKQAEKLESHGPQSTNWMSREFRTGEFVRL